MSPTHPAQLPQWRVLLAVAAVAVNLRLVMASVPPLVDSIAADLALSGAGLGALTTLPVACMGVFAPTASAVGARLGAERAILAALGCLGAGALLRGLGPSRLTLYAGTLVAGIGIALVGTLLPRLVKSLFPARWAGSATSFYFIAMMLGASLAAALTPPLATTAGWPIALSAWAVPAALGVLAWLPVLRAARVHSPTQPRPEAAGPAGRKRLPWRSGTARWLAAYLVLQSWQFFAALAWLAPSYLAAPWVWAIVLGIGQGSAFAVGLALLVRYAATPEASGRLTGMCFLLSYSTSAFGPAAYGAWRDLSGGLSVVWASLTLLMLAQAGISAAMRPDLPKIT